MLPYNKMSVGIGVAAVVCAAGAVVAGSDAPPSPVAPAISPLDQQYLTRCVRRMLEQRVQDGAVGPVPYVPPDLRDLNCQVLVTLRENGLHRGTGISEVRPILQACREAAGIALDRVAIVKTLDAALLPRLTLEIEVVGEPVPVGIMVDVLLAGPVERFIEPGVDGIKMIHGDTAARISPSEFAAFNMTMAEAVREVAASMTMSPDDLPHVRVARFRSRHWIQYAPGDRVIELTRGMCPVPPDAVTAAGLDDAADRLARYMLYRQQPTGRFSFAYDPGEDRYLELDDEVVQADATRALCAYAIRPGSSGAARSAAHRALGAFARRVIDLAGVDGAGFVRTPDGMNKLGVSALICLAMTECPDPVRYRYERDKLVGGMLWLQHASGKFVTAFPPADILPTQESYPGQALLALARVYDEQPQQRIMRAFDRALACYRELFQYSPSPRFAGWQIQAYARMAQPAKRDDFNEFVFRMADALVAVQLTERNCPYPDKWGAIAAWHPSLVGSATAAYLCGLCDALVLARKVGDGERAKAYEQAVRLGVRFLLQLEFKPQEAYFVRSARDAVGGVRTDLIDSTLRIDNSAHALLALTRARDVLFPTAR